jgi:uncharacterized membrane protein YidH (DUF202 family)
LIDSERGQTSAWGKRVLSVLEMLVGIVVTGYTVVRLTADQRVAPGFVETVVLFMVLLIGVALVYLGFERGKDVRHAQKRSRRGKHSDFRDNPSVHDGLG